jgi:photosystem II stability/assembly factor-like uncharacterized protein
MSHRVDDWEIKQLEIVAIALLSGLPDRLLMVSGSSPFEVACSDDGGLSYNIVFKGENSETVVNQSCLLVCNDGRTVFLATSRGYIYRSRDRGNQWAVVDAGVSFNRSYYYIIQSGDAIFAVTDYGVTHSRNMGDTWEIIDSPWHKYEAVDECVRGA